MELRATLGRGASALRDHVENFGHTGIVGLALIAFCAAFGVGGVQPLLEEVRTLQARQERLSAQQARAGDARPATPAKAVARELELPTAADALPQVMRLSDLAEKLGLKLRQGDVCTATAKPASRLIRCTIL